MKALLRYLIILAIFPISRVGAQEEAYRGDIPTTDGPLEVRMGLILSNITDVNEKDETIDIDGAIFLLWNDERLAYDPGSVSYPDNYQFTGKFVVEKMEVGSRVRGEWIGLRVEPLPCRTRTLLPAGRPEF